MSLEMFSQEDRKIGRASKAENFWVRAAAAKPQARRTLNSSDLPIFL
jgi:hypothetical protein